MIDVLTKVTLVAVAVGACVGIVLAVREYREGEPEDRKGVAVKVFGVLWVAAGAFRGAAYTFLGILVVGLVISLAVHGVLAVVNDNGTASGTAAAGYEPPPPCDPNYRGACLDPTASDYDCAGGGGDGPRYVSGPIRVRGSDPFGLDSTGDRIGCE